MSAKTSKSVGRLQTNPPGCRLRRFEWLMVILSVMPGMTAGCGTDFSLILFQALTATGQTALDLALTDTLNNLADQTNAQPQAEEEDNGASMDGTDIEPSDGPSDDQPPGDVMSDTAAGQQVFVSNNCSACHCDDASGGCALSAPNLQGVEQGVLNAILAGEMPHAGGTPDLSDQELADLSAYLADLGQS